MKILICLLAFTIVHIFAQPDPLETNVFGYFIPIVRPFAQQQPTPLQIRWLSILMNSAWESWSQYTPTSKGFFVGDSLRRPVAERTLRNKNTAIAYSFHTLLRHYFPAKNSTWDGLIASLGLPANDGTNRNPATPMGLSNLCMEKVLNFFSHDGWNSLGDMTGRIRNRVPYEDYTGYEPENSPYDSDINPDRWQPQFVTDSTYFIREQTFVVPQAGVAETFAIDVEDRDYDVARIRDTWRRNRNGYTANAEQILQESRNLNDRKKMIAEWFDDKFASLGTLTRFVAGQDLDRFIIIETLVNNAFMDGVSLMWFHKPRFDAVRPVTAVRWLKKNQDIVAWGGPAQGTITLKGKDWRPYLNTDSHPEYPSGTTCLCSIFAQVLRKYNGNDILNFTVSFPTGSSLMEPGFTPQSAVSVTYQTLTEMATECGNSRNWGGVHFRQSIDEAARVCPLVGDAVYNKFVKYLNGAADATPRTLCNNSGHGHGHGNGNGNGHGNGNGNGNGHGNGNGNGNGHRD